MSDDRKYLYLMREICLQLLLQRNLRKEKTSINRVNVFVVTFLVFSRASHLSNTPQMKCIWEDVANIRTVPSLFRILMTGNMER